MIVEHQGDLFESDANNIVHCISANARMGMGFAKTISNRYPTIRDDITKKNPQVGDCIVLEYDGVKIWNLVTKKLHYDKPTYQTLKSSLINLKRLMEEEKCRSYHYAQDWMWS